MLQNIDAIKVFTPTKFLDVVPHSFQVRQTQWVALRSLVQTSFEVSFGACMLIEVCHCLQKLTFSLCLGHCMLCVEALLNKSRQLLLDYMEIISHSQPSKHIDLKGFSFTVVALLELVTAQQASKERIPLLKAFSAGSPVLHPATTAFMKAVTWLVAHVKYLSDYVYRGKQQPMCLLDKLLVG